MYLQVLLVGYRKRGLGPQLTTIAHGSWFLWAQGLAPVLSVPVALPSKSGMAGSIPLYDSSSTGIARSGSPPARVTRGRERCKLTIGYLRGLDRRFTRYSRASRS